MPGLRAAATALAALVLVSCGGGGEHERKPQPRSEGPHRQRPAGLPPASLQPARCAAAAANCESATGPILYEQRVDPDGEGDAHLIIADSGGITLPGMTVIDVEPAIRPDPLPGIGEWVSAAGPVYPGSYGQRQIEATELNLESP